MATIPRGIGNTGVIRSASSPMTGGMPSPAGATLGLIEAGGRAAAQMVQQKQNSDIARTQVESRNQLNVLAREVSQGGFERSEDGTFSRANSGTSTFEHAPEAFDALSAQLRSEMVSRFTSNHVSNAVGNTFDTIAGQKRGEVVTAAVAQQRDYTVAQLDTNTELFQQQFANARTDQEKQEITLAFRDTLIGAVNTNAISRENMVARTQKFRNAVVSLEVQKELTDNIRSIEGTETVLEKLRSGKGYPSLQPQARQQFTEEALRQRNSAITFQFTMEQRQEAAARREASALQDQNTRDLSKLIRPTEGGVMGLPQAGHVEIDRAFQSGQIDEAQSNYLRALIDRPDPKPDGMVRGSWRFRFTAQAYNGTLNTDEVLYARTQGFINDNDVSSIMATHASVQAKGGVTATTDAKRALEFATSYLYGVKDMLSVKLENADVQELGIMELQFTGRVERGENPYMVVDDLITNNSEDLLTVNDLPAVPGVQEMYLRHQRSNTLDAFWNEARQSIMDAPGLSTASAKGMISQLERMRNKAGKKLTRLPAIREELRSRAAAYEKRIAK